MHPRTALRDVTLHNPSENVDSAAMIEGIEWATFTGMERYLINSPGRFPNWGEYRAV